MSKKSIAKTVSHELGHAAGLYHPWDEENEVSDINQNNPDVTKKIILDNLLNSDENPVPENRSITGTKLTSGQLQSIQEKVEKEQPK